MERKPTGENPYETIVLMPEPEAQAEPVVVAEPAASRFIPRLLVGAGVFAGALALVLLVWMRAASSPSSIAQSPTVPAASNLAESLPTSAPAPTQAPAPTAAPAPAAQAEAIVAQPIASTSRPAREPEPALPADALTLGTVSGEWLFDQPALQARAGQAVTLVFTNGSKTQPHNWVLVRGGADAAAAVSAAGASAGEAAGYLPSDANILASTRLLKGGEHEILSFSAPEAGTYAFICTVPGHFETGMEGKLVVE